MTVVYRPNEVMKKFELKESLYKKYIAALEREGYIIQKNQQGHRIFTIEDIEVLEKFIELIKYDGMTIETVAKLIGKMKGHDGMTEQYPNSHDDMTISSIEEEIEKTNSHDDMTEQKQESYDVMTLVERAVSIAIQAQEKQFTSKLQAHFQQTQEQLNKIENIASDRDKLLMQSIRESQEVKKLLLEVKEQVAATKEVKKGSWWQFWK